MYYGAKKEFINLPHSRIILLNSKSKMSTLPYIANWIIYLKFYNLGFSYNEWFCLELPSGGMILNANI